jgi:FtsP/CotA-like multicopper oxidase with cupredoxin domain
MHSHQGLQEQALLAAPLIIHDARDRADQREIVVMLADSSFTPAKEIFAGLRKGDAMAWMATSTTKPVAPKMTTMGSMPRTAATPDLNDVKYDAFLCNDRTLSDPEVISVEPGEIVLLRVINSSSMSAYPPRPTRKSLECQLLPAVVGSLRPQFAHRHKRRRWQRSGIGR